MLGSRTPPSFIYTGLPGLPISRLAPYNPLSTKQPGGASITEYNHPTPGLLPPSSPPAALQPACLSETRSSTAATRMHLRPFTPRPLHGLFPLFPATVCTTHSSFSSSRSQLTCHLLREVPLHLSPTSSRPRPHPLPIR